MEDSRETILERYARPLDEPRWRRINRNYVARAVTELLHERMITAEEIAISGDEHRLTIAGDDPSVRWTCVGRRRALDHWHIEPDSVTRAVNGVAGAADAAQFFLDLQRTIGTDPFTLTHFIEETAQTLYADACIASRGRPAAASLVDADYQAVERAMEGHPWVLVNKGRIGFDAADQHRFAPEMGAPQQLVWLAAHRRRATFHALNGMDHDGFMSAQLGRAVTEAFRDRLSEKVAAPHEYVFIPVHAWQWTHKIAIQCAADIATGALVPLGVPPDLYTPQQSIRTFFDRSTPGKCYVKTALSVLNTFQIRGLDPRKLALAPRVTAWLDSVLGADPYLQELGVVILGEVATVAYEHPIYRQIPDGPYQYREMLGALWRESPFPYLAPGETLATMASLLYVDDGGNAFVQALADRSGLGVEGWVQRYLDAYFRPLLHCFYRHETYFVAHGENTILVLRDGVPTRVVFKDLVEEVQVSRRQWRALPEDFRGLLYDLDEPLIPLFILTDVFDGFFRYLSDVLATHAALPQDRFWGLVAGVVRDYQEQHPELAAEFARYDLFCDEFPRYCLNKYRLVYHGYAEVARNVHDLSPKFAGTLRNPLSAHRPAGVFHAASRTLSRPAL
jgi:siderophore synthetase component